MNDDISSQIRSIQRMQCSELRKLWREVFHEEPRSGNVPWMRRRLAWGIQAAALGGLSEAAKKRIEELTPLALASMPWGRRSFPSRNEAVPPTARGRLAPGTVLTRRYKGGTLEVLVREDGFEYDGRLFGSLSAVATAITGSHWNGPLFFGLNEKRESA